jgi:hypothetical protein
MSLHTSVLVVGAVILSSGLVPSAGGAQAGPLSAAVSGLVPIPVGPLATNFAWSGGGFVMPLSRSRSPVSADFGVRYYDLGGVTYTTPFVNTSLPTPNPPPLPPPMVRRHQATMIAPSIGLTWRL